MRYPTLDKWRSATCCPVRDPALNNAAIDEAILEHVRTSRIPNRHWVETPVHAVISEVRQDTGLNIVELRNAELPNIGITMDMDDAEVATVLTKVLDPLGRMWVVEHGLVIIKLK